MQTPISLILSSYILTCSSCNLFFLTCSALGAGEGSQEATARTGRVEEKEEEGGDVSLVRALPLQGPLPNLPADHLPFSLPISLLECSTLPPSRKAEAAPYVQRLCLSQCYTVALAPS